MVQRVLIRVYFLQYLSDNNAAYEIKRAYNSEKIIFLFVLLQAWELTVKNCRFDCGDKEFTKKPAVTAKPTITENPVTVPVYDDSDIPVAKRSIPDDFDDGVDDSVLAKKLEGLPESPYICFNRSL